jgi:hypothetical protein
LAAIGALAGASGGPASRYLTYSEVRGLVAASGNRAPEALTGLSESRREAFWATWARQRDTDVRERVLRADEDSLAYLLVFGTSFTRAPRFTRLFLQESAQTIPGAASQIGGAVATERIREQAFDARLADMVRALEAPGTDERLAWARATLDRLGYRLDTAAGRTRASRYLLDNLARVTKESESLGARLKASEALGDRSTELAERARLFAGRGLASDTSWPINFALAESLKALAARKTLPPRSVRRVAIVGPGLDFVDKDEGHDYYPPQSLQPFAVIDALATSGLSDGDALTVTTLDLSPRVNSHIRTFAARASTRPYDLQLVRSRDVRWTAAAAAYFDGFGAHVGRAVPAIVPPATAGHLDVRAVRVSPEWLRRVGPVDFDAVYQRIDMEEREQCDIVVATNVLLYYEVFEQSLAIANLAHIMRSGAVLLTNTRLDDLPSFPLRRIGESAHAFSDRPGDGEYVFVYQKADAVGGEEPPSGYGSAARR